MTGAWPPRWEGPQFKQSRSRKVERARKREKRELTEDQKKNEVRRRDGRHCRFPLCGCKRFKLALHVAHSTHKGMGGNPKEDRSEPETMVLVCSARHKELLVSIDRGNVRWRPLTKNGSNGPIAWDVAGDAIGLSPINKWIEVARETGVQQLAPSTAFERAILTALAQMKR